MLLQIKIYLISILYIFGALFMILFPPRNFVQSGAKLRSLNVKENATPPEYLSPNSLVGAVERFVKNDPEAASMMKLTPPTAQNRNIIALQLRSDRLSRKPGILIVGGLNGMAWNVPKAIIQLAEKLLYDSSYQTPFFNDYDWYLIPCGNPDGLHFTQSVQKLPPLNIEQWSKNLTVRATTRPAEWHKNVDNETDKESCFGTNINRNFAFHWQGDLFLSCGVYISMETSLSHASLVFCEAKKILDDVQQTPERCSQFYPGIKPFSTAEAQAIRRYVDKLGDTIQLAIHLHASFVPKKEFILYPWRYSLRQPSNFKTLQDIGEYAARQARMPDGRLYEVHQSSSDERVAGSFSDYVSGVVGVDLVYIVKPYHEPFPNFSRPSLDDYENKAIKAVLSIVRGWRRSTKLNTLSFFGRDVEF